MTFAGSSFLERERAVPLPLFLLLLLLLLLLLFFFSFSLFLVKSKLSKNAFCTMRGSCSVFGWLAENLFCTRFLVLTESRRGNKKNGRSAASNKLSLCLVLRATLKLSDFLKKI